MSGYRVYIKILIQFVVVIIIILFGLLLYFVKLSLDHEKQHSIKFVKPYQFHIYEFSAANNINCKKYSNCNPTQFLIDNYDKNNLFQKKEIDKYSCKVFLNKKIKQIYFYRTTRFTNNNYTDKFPNEIEYYSRKNDVIFQYKLMENKVVRTEFNLEQAGTQIYHRNNKIDTIICNQ